ncbi:ABC transporter [Mycena rebaudengoi]|nr:ABC transporter [Mycena rebaudengoi]
MSVQQPNLRESSEEALVGSPSVHSVTNDAKDNTPPEDLILTGKQLAAVFVALLLSMFSIALDQTIFHRPSTDCLGLQLLLPPRLGPTTSFVLAQTVFLLFYGQLLRIFPAKWIMVSSILIFETGSLVCGLAQNVDQLIAGRVVSGVAEHHVVVAMTQVISQVTRLEDRPRLIGLFGAVFGLSTVIGPLIGGAFTDHVTWRWVFFINLPIGGVSLTAVLLLLKASPPLGADLTKRSPKDIFQQVLRLDYVGAILVACAVTSLVLALQWGGNTKPWDDKSVIICFVFAAVLTVVYIVWETRLGDRAMVPTAIFKSRSIYAILAFCLLTRFSLLLFSYYIPIYYQAVKHRSATDSGIELLPFMLGVVVTVISTSQIVGKFGYYWPFLVAAPVILAIGSGLLYTLETTSSAATIIGFQILAGVGTGMGMQNSLLAMQVEFNSTPALIGQANSMASFAQFLGGTLGLGIAEPVFATQLAKLLLKYAPDAPDRIVKESPTAIYTQLAPEMRAGVVRAYAEALRIVFVLGVPVAGFALVCALFIGNLRIIKTGAGEEKDDAEKGAADAEKRRPA